MDPSSTTDAGAGLRALLQGVAQGRPEAIDTWYRGEHPEVYRLCLGFLADACEAEDVAQDAMLHLLDHLDRWDPARPYRSWRDTIVLNRCRDRLRRGAARGRAREALETLGAGGASSEQPGDALERREAQAILMEALTGLSPREREAFVLRDLEELSSREAALAMGVGESTVRSLLTLARRRLRGLLAGRLFPEGVAAGEDFHG